MKRLYTVLALSLILGACSMAGLAAGATIQDADTDNDNHLSYQEYYDYVKDDPNDNQLAKEQGLTMEEYAKKVFNAADTNNDNKISKAEIKAYVTKKH